MNDLLLQHLPSRRRVLTAGAGLAASALSFPTRADEKRYRILMILYRGWEDACSGFRDYFETQKMDVELIVRDIDRDLKKIPGLVAEAREMRPDLIYLWGTNTAIEALGPWDKPDPARHITDIPTIFNIVTEPAGNGIIKSEDEPGRPVTGTLYIVPIEVQIRTMLKYLPAKRIGTTYNPAERNSVLIVEKLKRFAPNVRCTVDAIPLPAGKKPTEPDVNAIPDIVRKLKANGADWLYIPPDTFLLLNRDLLTGTALAERLPAFCPTEPFIRGSKALFGLVCRYYSIGQLTASKAELILRKGIEPGRIPVRTLDRFSLLVNMASAKELELYPPMNILRIAEAV